MRDGYTWEKSAALDKGLEITQSRMRPQQSASDPSEAAQGVFLEYMQLFDFASANSYTRITSYDQLSPCHRNLNIHLQKLVPQKATSMVLTFYNYREVCIFWAK